MSISVNLRALRVALAGLAVGATLAVTATSAAAAVVDTWGPWTYDGCQWRIEHDFYLQSGSNTEVDDVNGGCHYLTAWIRNSQNTVEARSGPINSSSVSTASISSAWDTQHKGRVTTWEHEWTQTLGWYDEGTG